MNTRGNVGQEKSKYFQRTMYLKFVRDLQVLTRPDLKGEVDFEEKHYFHLHWNLRPFKNIIVITENLCSNESFPFFGFRQPVRPFSGVKNQNFFSGRTISEQHLSERVERCEQHVCSAQPRAQL